MKKSLFLLFLGVVFMSSQIIAQMSVSGTVSDADGEPLIGVNIVEKGTTNGTVTDLDGNYSIKVAEGSKLVFSYVGYDSQEFAAAATVNVVMLEAGILEEIVVTATSVERNAREVVYANQTVSSEDLNSSPNSGAISALQGKLAGVKIQQGSGNVGASTRIVLRGETSLTGNNNALIVVDGVPIDNSSQQGGQGSSTDGFVDFGNRGNDLNPEDIESVTVLKGPSATSLYGSRGASGVVLITTKKGAAGGKKFSVGLTTSTTFEKAYVQLKRQNEFGQGYATCDCDPNDLWSGENFSWGPRFDGVVRPWTSPVLIDTDGDGTGDEYQFLSRPFSAVDNQLESYFDLGRTTNTSVNFSGGNDKYTYYASYTNTNADGIVPSTFLKKNGFNLNASAQFSDKLKSNFGVNLGFINQKASSEGNTFSSGIPNGYFYAVQTPVNIPFNELRDYNSPFHGFDGYYGAFTINPYFILNESSLTNAVSNVRGNYDLTYTPIEGLSLTGRVGANFVNSTIEEKLPVFEYADHAIWVNNQQLDVYTGREQSSGFYRKTNQTNVNLDLTGQATYQKDFGSSGDFSLLATAGYNFFQRTTEQTSGETVGGITIPGFYTLANSVQAPLAQNQSSKYRIMGAYGNASFGWRNMVFVEYSARNDWSSTLPEGNRGFFYQAGGLSFIASELIPKNNALSYMKVRLSAGTTGKDAPLYALASTYIPVNTLVDFGDPDHNLTAPVNGQAIYTASNRIGNPNLEPELALTIEAGLDVSFYKNRISAEYTYYNTSNKNQIVLVNLPESSGYVDAFQNVGEISNIGHELTVKVNPIPASLKDVKMNLFWNFAKNKSEVIKISEDSDELDIRSFGGFGNAGIISLVAAEGLPYGTFKALEYKRDPNGNIVVNPNNGQPLLTDDQTYQGSYQPDFITSFGTDLGWKGIRANILFDVRKGGQYFSYTKGLSEFNGTASTTTLNDREAFVVEGSVVEVDNGDGTFSYVENTQPVTVYNYITNQPGGNDLVDASFIKLRELGLSYTLPGKLFENNPLSSITVGFVARNLKFWLADENTFADPEVNGVDGTGNGVGIESHATPTSRSYGFKIDVKF